MHLPERHPPNKCTKSALPFTCTCLSASAHPLISIIVSPLISYLSFSLCPNLSQKRSPYPLLSVFGPEQLMLLKLTLSMTIYRYLSPLSWRMGHGVQTLGLFCIWQRPILFQILHGNLDYQSKSSSSYFMFSWLSFCISGRNRRYYHSMEYPPSSESNSSTSERHIHEFSCLETDSWQNFHHSYSNHPIKLELPEKQDLPAIAYHCNTPPPLTLSDIDEPKQVKSKSHTTTRGSNHKQTR